MVDCRKPRAGEDWTRGNDLPDGPYSYETWIKIKNAIIKKELVKIAKKARCIPDKEVVIGEDKVDNKNEGKKGKNKEYEIDDYMALLRRAKEEPNSKFSYQEKKILNFIKKAPSYNEVFRKGDKYE